IRDQVMASSADNAVRLAGFVSQIEKLEVAVWQRLKELVRNPHPCPSPRGRGEKVSFARKECVAAVTAFTPLALACKVLPNCQRSKRKPRKPTGFPAALLSSSTDNSIVPCFRYPPLRGQE